MKFVFHPAARDEFAAAAEYYEDAVPSLGSRFSHAVRRAIDLALAHPEAGERHAGAIRRVNVAGFPYRVVYQARGGVLEILAVAHTRRRPGYWRDRTAG